MADLRTYRGRNLPEILRRVRAELGPTAAILHTRETGSALTRWLGGGELEVVASNEVDVPSRLPANLSTPSPAPPSAARQGGPITESPLLAASLWAPAERGDSDRSFAADEDEDEFLPQLRALGTPAGLLQRWRQRLQSERRPGAAPPTPHDWLRLAEDELTLHGPLRLEPSRRKLVAVVGPTGVGKTTTIAKLAGNFLLKEQARVGLITLDTFRIAAVDQLQTYAHIMEAPLEVVAAPREMTAALKRLENCDLVLIDTIGRSPHAASRIRELKAFLAEARPDEVHLALSAASSLDTLHDCLDAFAPLQPTALLLTKCDEARRLAPLWPVLADSPLPLSYTTHGQNVPDDIRPAQRRTLACELLGWNEATSTFPERQQALLTTTP